MICEILEVCVVLITICFACFGKFSITRQNWSKMVYISCMREKQVLLWCLKLVR